MATVREFKRKRGFSAYQIHFKLNGGRRYLSLGSNYRKEDAQEISFFVDRLVASIESGRPLDRQTTVWLETASGDLKERLERSALIEVERVPTLEDIFDAYWEAEFYDMKPTTQRNKKQSRRKFFEFVDRKTRFDAFTKRDASAFATYLSSIVSEATRAGIVKDVRRVFNWAKEFELIEKNPFDGVKRGSFKNKSREYYVSWSDYEKILDACPSRMWRALLALYRVGGLRFSEALRAQWSDVDFPRGRMLIHSPKTERYAGKDSRVIPLFPELRVELENLWEETPEGGSPYIISENPASVRRNIDRIIFFAGLNRWERLIQNLRSSRAIEVARDFGELAESEWIGHSPQTARDHYLHLLDADFDRAAREGTKKAAVRAGRVAKVERGVPLF